jgi:excisionase family DNA binding protein
MQYLTVREIARELQVSELTVCAWLRRGKLGGLKPGGKSWRIPQNELERFLERVPKGA